MVTRKQFKNIKLFRIIHRASVGQSHNLHNLTSMI